MIEKILHLNSESQRIMPREKSAKGPLRTTATFLRRRRILLTFSAKVKGLAHPQIYREEARPASVVARDNCLSCDRVEIKSAKARDDDAGSRPIGSKGRTRSE